ncbi:MAG: hypothetical protein ACM3N5_08925 [Candidatus Eiseniibacteriota bacterium]
MIFGSALQRTEQADRTAHIWWAWFPVRLLDGRTAWLEAVCRWWHEGEPSRSASGAQIGGWRYAAFARRTRPTMAGAQ